jgi:hypothetical protein
MTLLEMAQLLGNFGEFFGAVAVAVTLVFLTVQLRQNTKMVRAQVNQSRADAAQSQNMSLYNSPYLPEIALKRRSSEELTEVEIVRWESYLRAYHRLQNNVYWQYRQGLLDDHIPRSLALSLQNVVGRHEHSKQHWERMKVDYSDEYADFVDEVITRT